MTILQYVLPIFLFLGAIGCTFIDIKQPKGPMFIGAIGVLMLLFLGFDLYLTAEVNNEKENLKAKVEDSLAWQKRSVANLQGILASFTPDSDQKTIEMRKLVNLGWTTNNAIFQESFAANEEREKLIALVRLQFIPLK